MQNAIKGQQKVDLILMDMRMKVCCSVLQCVAVRYSVLQCVSLCGSASYPYGFAHEGVLQCVVACCNALQCIAVRFTVWQCILSLWICA